MENSLLISIRFHEGRYHGTGDWPPSPARLFQALMAGAARGARIPNEAKQALDWLETLPPPTIAAPHHIRGQAFKNYVPDNDLDAETSKSGVLNLETAVSKIRRGKQICPILFVAETPILYCWFFDDDRDQAEMLCSVTRDLDQLGRGIDQAWAEAWVLGSADAKQKLADHDGIVYRPVRNGRSELALQCPSSGSRQSLTTRFEEMNRRFRPSTSRGRSGVTFVQPPKAKLTKVAYNAPPHRLVFDLRDGQRSAAFSPWPLVAAATLVREVRDQAAARLIKAAPRLKPEVERYFIGRGAIDADKELRVQVAPIPSVGHKHADLDIRRLVVYVPQSCPLRPDDLAWAFAQVVWTDDDGVIVRELQPADQNKLMVERFEKPSRVWRTVTPLALSIARRRPTQQTGTERASEETRDAAAVLQALRHAGFGVPATAVRMQREPFDVQGARAEVFASGTRFPTAKLRHAEITFAKSISGPLLLGDGRYLGLGLMRPLELADDVVVFSIEGGLAKDADPVTIAHAARRAMMVRVQHLLPKGAPIPSYISGHEADGQPARSGEHRHIAITIDLPRRRILFLAPRRLKVGGRHQGYMNNDHRIMIRALEGMEELRAGKAGRLVLALRTLDAESDPLFAPSRTWESLSDYICTRRHRRLSEEEALTVDVLGELQRIDWPVPVDTKVLAVRCVSQGRLAGRVRLTFAVAQAGPLIIGRTLHKGGGLFVSSD